MSFIINVLSCYVYGILVLNHFSQFVNMWSVSLNEFAVCNIYSNFF